MKKKKKKVSQSKILLIILIILIPVVVGIVSLHKLSVETNNNPSEGGVYSQKDNSLVTYDQAGIDELHNLQQNKQPLSPADETVKTILMEQVNPLAKTDDYTITYDPTTDMFQAQITTISINDAKDEVVQWFTNQGMSTDALCKLPVEFTLDDSIANSLKGLDIIFNPLAPGC